jgi:hypothetical protein
LKHNFVFSDKSICLKYKSYIDKALIRASWTGTEEEKNYAQIISILLFLGLRFEFLDKKYVSSTMIIVLKTLPINDWFRPFGLIYGTSFMLRALLILYDSDYRYLFIDYLYVLCESLLRRVEIKKEQILPFDVKKGSSLSGLLEHLRYIVAILEISVVYNDVRFLNAAMKANDRVYPLVKQLCITNKGIDKNIKNILIAHYYIQSIKIQEERFSLICQL